jgi:AcrR family transcriptional regulator
VGRRRSVDVSALVDAAARVFERRGYADATLADIASEAGVSKPTVYQYVESKQRLLEIIVEQLIYPLRDGITAIVTTDADPAVKLDAYITLHVSAACRHQVYFQVLLADRRQLSETARRQYQAWARDVDRHAADLLRQGVTHGVVRDDIDIDVAVNLLNSTLTSIARWYRPNGPLTPDRIRDEVVKFLSGTLLAPLDAGRSSPPAAVASD